MKFKWFACLLICTLIPVVSGCYSTVGGQNRAGVPFLKDTIEAKYPRPVDQVATAVRAALAFNGTITSDDSVTRVITAKINNRTVYVGMEELEPQITRVLVQARTSGGGSDIELAAEMDKQIALRLVK